MYCVKCGSEAKGEADRFCWNCGAALQDLHQADQAKQNQEQVCVVECAQVGEKFSLYGKDMYVYRAVLDSQEGKKVVAQSAEFVLTGFSYTGPSMKNRYHKEPLDTMVASLESRGWVQEGKHGKEWYSLKFRKADSGKEQMTES